jgi:hypothetical protein
MNWKIIILILLIPALTLLMSALTPKLEIAPAITGQITNIKEEIQPIITEPVVTVTPETLEKTTPQTETKTIKPEEVIIRDYELILYNYAVQYNVILNRARTSYTIDAYQNHLWNLEGWYEQALNHSNTYAELLTKPEHIHTLTKVNDYIAGLSGVREMLNDAQTMLDTIKANETGNYTEDAVQLIHLDQWLTYTITG